MTEGPGLKRKIGAVRLKLDGKPIPMKGFVQDFVGLTIVGMLSSLKGVSDPREIELAIRVR